MSDRRDHRAGRTLLLASLWSPMWLLPMACQGTPVVVERSREVLEAQLVAAERNYTAQPDDPDAAIWVGRRLGYLGRFEQAVEVYTRALDRFGDDARLLRHRGHRYLSLRDHRRAIADFERAAEQCRTEPDAIEPDGLPVPGRPPHSSLHFNVHYHLGLAHFLARDFAAAERAWLDCLAVVGPRNDEARVAVCHWLWSVRMRLGDAAGARAVVAGIGRDLDVVENVSYHRLCLLYAGRLQRAELAAGAGSSGAALGFGLAHHDLVRGRVPAARQQLQALVARGGAAFGVLAAEAELGIDSGAR